MDEWMRQVMNREPLHGSTVIDVHGHWGDGAAFPLFDASEQSLIDTMNRTGVRRLILSHYAGINGYARHGNDETIALVQRHPERLMGYFCIDPATTEADVVKEMERCHAAGLRAWKLHTMAHVPYDAPIYRAGYEWADAHCLPLLVHTWGTELPSLEPQFRRYRNIRFLLAHAGAAAAEEEYIRLAQEYEHVYLELSYSRCPDGLVERLTAAVGAEKVLWGSDMNYMSEEFQIGRVIFADLSLMEKQAILGKNAIRIFGLSEQETI